jgi:hypothetical protein
VRRGEKRKREKEKKLPVFTTVPKLKNQTYK